MKMNHSNLLLLIILLTFLSCTTVDGSGSAESGNKQVSKGKLFLKTIMYGTSLDISWIYMGSDGLILVNPKHGVDPINVPAETKDNLANVGTYAISGDEIKIKWKNGKSENWSFEKTDGQYSSLDGGVVTQPKALPANYKLKGIYSAGAVTANLSASSTIIFSPDGKFTEGRRGTVVTENESSMSSDQRIGTYSISGNTLKLKYTNGETYIAVIALWKLLDDKNQLIINSSSYPEQNY